MLYSYKGKPSNLESINVQLSRKDIHEYNLQMRAILDDLKNDSEVRQKVEALILNLAEQIESTESSLKSLKSDLKTYIL